MEALNALVKQFIDMIASEVAKKIAADGTAADTRMKAIELKVSDLADLVNDADDKLDKTIEDKVDSAVDAAIDDKLDSAVDDAIDSALNDKIDSALEDKVSEATQDAMRDIGSALIEIGRKLKP